MHEKKPSFTIEKDKIGLGKCIIAQWPDGRREVVTGFGTEDEAQNWVNQDAAQRLAGRHRRDPK